MVKRRYSKIKGVHVTLLDTSTKSMRKRGELGKGQVVVQSLSTGKTAVVNRNRLGKIKYTSDYFKKKK